MHPYAADMMERGERNLRYKNLLKLAHGLNIELTELVPRGTAD